MKTQNGNSTPATAIQEPEYNKSAAVSETEIVLETDTPVPVPPSETPLATLLPKLTPTFSEIPQPTLATGTSSFLVTPTSEPRKPTGYLYLYNSSGIQKVDLKNDVTEYVLTAEDNWLDWSARFAQNEKYLAYWVKHTNSTELWFTSLEQWQPERILEIDNVTYDFATPTWGVNDRYLFFVLSVLDTSGPLEDIRTLRTYIIDVETMEMVSQSYWEGDCSILAASPQTNKLALWCHKVSNQDGPQEYFVLEPDAAPWRTEQPPEILIDNCLVMLICAWSSNHELVAYVVNDRYPELLFYTSVDSPIPIPLDDNSTKIYSFPEWSPNNQFLYYAGACGGASLQCPNILYVPDKKIIWRVGDNSNRGEFGNILVSSVVWSPDSNYIAIPILTSQVVIFDIITRQEVSRIHDLEHPAEDMVWATD